MCSHGVRRQRTDSPMWSLSTLTSTLQSAAETASASLKKAADDLTKEYEATTARPAETVLPVMTHEAQPLSALDSAKQLGSKLFNPLEDAGGSTAGDQAVGPSRVVMLPWEAPGLSEGVRSRMRALSQERSIFLAPPAGGHASFRFDLASSLPLVLEALSIDRRLEEQRHLLVPSQVAEETFFIRMIASLIRMIASLIRSQRRSSSRTTFIIWT